MSAVGRLWRRAPAWRVWLGIAIASSALCAMFPPVLPALHIPGLKLPGLAGSSASGARFVPQPEAPPVQETAIAMPLVEANRATLIPFAGRKLPLPAGRWSDLVLVRAQGAPPGQAMVLARLQKGRMTGMIIVTGTSALAQGAPMPLGACLDPGRSVHDLTPGDGRDPALQECWGVNAAPTSQMLEPKRLLSSRAFQQLGRLDIAVPVHLLAVGYFRHDDQGMMDVTILLPDPAQSPALMHRTEAWAQHWVKLMHRGFDGTLSASDVTPELARDPETASTP